MSEPALQQTVSRRELRRPLRPARDRSIDLIRGLCITSMISGHIAAASLLSVAFHIIPKFDGASGFVLLGGLVLGIVRRAQVNSIGVAGLERKTARQIFVLYTAQLVLVGLGVWAAFGGWESRNFPQMQTLSAEDLAAHSLMMTLAPPGGDVLRLYVFLLGLCMIAYPLLVRGWWIAVLSGSLGIHVLGQFFPNATSFSPFPEQAASAGWAGWQLLFISALVLGWYWKEANVPEILDRHGRKFLVISAAIVAVAAAGSLLLPQTLEEAIFSKYTFPVGRVLVAYAVVTVLYIGVRLTLRFVPLLWFRPLVSMGSYSLDSYIIQAVVVIVGFGFGSLSSSSSAAFPTAVATLLLCWGWAEIRIFRNRRTIRRVT